MGGTRIHDAQRETRSGPPVKDCREYDFLAAGQGEKYGNYIKKLKPGDLVFGYMKGLGYVGFGTVTRPHSEKSSPFSPIVF